MSREKIELDPGDFQELLNKHTRKELAEIFKCSERSISRYMAKHNLKSARKKKSEFEIIRWFDSQDRSKLPKTLDSLSKLSGFRSSTLRRFLDKEKVRDLEKAQKVMSWIEDNPDYLWVNKGHTFRTRNVKKLNLSHDRISREIKIFLTLHDYSTIIRKFDSVDQLYEHFIEK